ncbi:Glycosyltransferase involved in cell wall biogenesis [Hoeflea phototrophica DFL-43]|uniref:Glycosyltransferase involved in cell wall biogenesis n=1 Tax=Hoeflea phototrophica (strain DSM 17068 / NCIMB 14078 / DFL-43) TaxID=411684 RepID=A9CZ80_HOEPD|nr:Glycosyltransferase involved in cell wall biogenesis [Hoeflea phototrophica DFL-43]
MVYFTICIPTRNRQSYCIEALKAIAESRETDFEVLVADNSDDPAILDDFFRNHLKDDRFRLLPPEQNVLSMVDNWERTVAEVGGRWVTIIGDDDHIEPSLIQILRRYEREYNDLEAVSWARMSYNWPDNRTIATLASVPTGHETYIPKKRILHDHLFRWSQREKRPSCGFGIYHGAVRRSLMERIKRKYSNRYFEHPTVDFDNSCKVIREAKTLVHCQRPLSVLGACGASNSASTQSFELMKKLADDFYRELGDGQPIQEDDFPFSPRLPGLAIISSIAAATWWFCRKYDVDNEGFQENFAHAAVHECLSSRTVEEYEIKVEGLRRGFAAFEGGAWSKHFNPPEVFVPSNSQNQLCGVFKGSIYIRESRLKAATPSEFYRFAQSFVMPVEHVASGRQAFAA